MSYDSLSSRPDGNRAVPAAILAAVEESAREFGAAGPAREVELPEWRKVGQAVNAYLRHDLERLKREGPENSLVAPSTLKGAFQYLKFLESLAYSELRRMDLVERPRWYDLASRFRHQHKVMSFDEARRTLNNPDATVRGWSGDYAQQVLTKNIYMKSLKERGSLALAATLVDGTSAASAAGAQAAGERAQPSMTPQRDDGRHNRSPTLAARLKSVGQPGWRRISGGGRDPSPSSRTVPRRQPEQGRSRS
ncbi:hypothetical protein [Phytohabitans suffuscus]|uniref:Uncharacterized protein n=1 Tax=Phytohabitans suffuscus TaxID=624315 RepID=A0A6F8YA34_9ACTN|nr:hypothetical protein [Phytohabitans suffuscus]BCB82927.1 hypothetical protein Psuf_002400 [Phytohabitans suffuscus]